MVFSYKVRRLRAALRYCWGRWYLEYLPDLSFVRHLDKGVLQPEYRNGAKTAREAVLGFSRHKFHDRCRFFFDKAGPGTIRGLLGNATQTALLAAADRICAHYLPLLGYSAVFCGNPLAWNRDPLTQNESVRGRFGASYETSDTDWRFHRELHFHRHLCTLAQAYVLTENDKYAEEIVGQLDGWLREHCPAADEQQTSALACAIRVNAWIWALYALSSWAGLSEDFYWRVLKSIFLQTRFIEQHLQPAAHANNHRISEAWGLITVGLLFPEFCRAAHWRELGLTILCAETTTQFAQDGGHKEKALNYHRMVVDYYSQVVLLCRRNGISLPPVLLEQLNAMFDFLLAVVRPDGRVPGMGDAGTSALWPDAELEQVASTLAVGAVVFDRGDLKHAARNIPDMALWLVGADGWQRFLSLPDMEPAAVVYGLESSGMYTRRSDWSADADYLLFDCGEQGLPGRPGHSHADALSLEMGVRGCPVLVDSGTYLYHGEKQWRDYFRGTSAHNTIRVDGQDQAIPGAATFSWRAVPRARCHGYRHAENVEENIWFVDGEHDGYLRLPDSVLHRRRILAVGHAYILVCDEVLGEESHELESFWHFAPGALRQVNNHWFMFTAQDSDYLAVRVLSSAVVNHTVACGQEQPVQGWYSKTYGLKEPAPVLINSQRGKLPLFFLTLFVPIRTPRQELPEFALLPERNIRCVSNFGAAGYGCRVRCGPQEDLVVFASAFTHDVCRRGVSGEAVVVVERRKMGRLRMRWRSEGEESVGTALARAMTVELLHGGLTS